MIKKGIIGWVMCVLLLVGCSGSSTPKATDKTEFYLYSEMDGQQVLQHAVYTYNDDQMMHGELTITYTGLEETQTNNIVFTQYRTLVSMLSDLQGVEATIDTEETGYTYKEVWDYTDLSVEDALNVDERQQEFITDGKYDIQKIKEYYEIRGYSVSHQKIEE